jgi:hypothetical protein
MGWGLQVGEVAWTVNAMKAKRSGVWLVVCREEKDNAK